MAAKDKSTDLLIKSEVVRNIEVNDLLVPLVVSTDFDLKKGTYKIKTEINSKHIDVGNTEMQGALIEQLGDMLETAVEEAIKKQYEFDKKAEEQLQMDFNNR